MSKKFGLATQLWTQQREVTKSLTTVRKLSLAVADCNESMKLYSQFIR